MPDDRSMADKGVRCRPVPVGFRWAGSCPCPGWRSRGGRSSSWSSAEKSHTPGEETMLRLGIIVGSPRPGRKAEVGAGWVHEIAKKRGDAGFEVVDAQDFTLPLLDEPVPPSLGQYSKPHTKAWAAKV